MGHHYVPQFYLSGFTDRDRLWVHDRKAARSFPSQPKAIANENDLYTEELEQHLANEVEDPAKRAIETIRARVAPTGLDREALARYVIALRKRVPEGRIRAVAGVPEVAASLRQEYAAGLEAAATSDPTLRDRADTRLAQLNAALDKFILEPPPEVWHNNLTRDSSPEVVESLLSMTWRFLCTDRQQLLTCDNPVFFFEHEGIGNPSSELSLPLSSSVALWASRRPLAGATFLVARPATVRELNRRTAVNATRFIYSKRQEEWILPFVCKGSYALNRII
jgi:hypothetical protein